MIVVEVLFWVSLAGILWTHAGYPLAAALLARVRTREVRKDDVTPTVSVIVPAHDEESVIGARLDNLLALDYPPEQLEIVVVSDGSTDGTDVVVAGYAARDPRVRLLALPRGGKLAALNHAVGESTRAVVAFSDANSKWAPNALRMLVRNLADDEVAYVCGKLVLEGADGTNREGIYWRYELWLRESESRAGLDHRRQRRDLCRAARGLRGSSFRPGPRPARRDGQARQARRLRAGGGRNGEARGEPRGRVPPQGAHVPVGVAAHDPGADARRRRAALPLRAALASRAAVHERPLAPRPARVEHRPRRRGRRLPVVLARAAWVARARGARPPADPLPGAGIAYYYFLVTWATVAALVSYLRFGVSPHWERAEGAR